MNMPLAESALAEGHALSHIGGDILPDRTNRLSRRERRRLRVDSGRSAVDRLRGDEDNVVPISPPLVTAERAHTETWYSPNVVPLLDDRDAAIAWLQEALPANEPMMYVQLGLDHFRQLNVDVGPEIGDVALRRAGSVLDWAFGSQPVGRLGGDCFGVLIPYDGLPATLAVVRRALDLLANADLSGDGSGLHATASAGVTLLDRPELTAAGIILEADLAMAAAKAAGRNRVEVHNGLAT